MAGKGFRLTWNPTAISGTVTKSMTDWPQVINGSVRLNHIFLIASQNITFDFKIKSPSGNVIFSRKDIPQELNEPLNLVMRGLYSLTIENASADDTFTGEFMMEDCKAK